MDFLFNCAACKGPLIAHNALRGRMVLCAHCARAIPIGAGRPVTEAMISALLDAPLPVIPTGQQVLRRVRPAARHTSAGACPPRAKLPRSARLS